MPSSPHRPSSRRLMSAIGLLAAVAGTLWWMAGNADRRPTTTGEVRTQGELASEVVLADPNEPAASTRRENTTTSTSTTNQKSPPAKGSASSITPPQPTNASAAVSFTASNAAPGSVAIQSSSPGNRAAPAPDNVPLVPSAPAPAPPPFIPPTPQQMRDQPASVTAAQVLSQQLDPNDPAIQAEAVRILTESADLRRKLAWERARQKGWETEGKTRGGGYFVLIDFDGDRPLYHETENVDAAMSIATDQVRNAPLSLNGDGMVIGLWEPSGGVLTTHQEFLSAIGPGVLSIAPGTTVILTDRPVVRSGRTAEILEN